MSTEKTSWIGSLIAAVVSIFHKTETVVDEIFKVSDAIVNEVKVLQSSTIAQFLETGIEALLPQFEPVIEGFKIWLPKAAGLIAGIETSVHTDEEKMQAFLDHLSALDASGEQTLKAGALNTLNAGIQQFIASNSAVTTLTPQMSLSASQLVHDPTLGGALK